MDIETLSLLRKILEAMPDTAVSDSLAAAERAETAQQAAEDAASSAAETLESIPEDYSELSGEVSDLKENFNNALEKSNVGYIYTELSNGYWDTNANLTTYANAVCNTEKILCPENVTVYVELASTFPNSVNKYISYYDENNVRIKREQSTGKIYSGYSPAGTKYLCYCYEYSGMNKDNAGSVVVFVNNPILNMAGAIKAGNQLMTKGSYISSSNGNAVAHSDTYCYSDFEPIWFLRNFPLSIYCYCASAYNIGLAFYDEGKNFISGYTEPNTASPQKIKTTVPSNAYYVRFTGYTSFSLNTQDYYLVIDPVDMRYVPLVQNVQELAYSNLKRYEEEYAQLSNYLRFGVIGDSFASGVTASGDNYPASWGQNIARLCGITCTNYSHGGLTTKTWLTDERGLSKLNNSSTDDLYFCCLGLNDFFEIFNGRYTLGTIGDIYDDSTLNPDTFYGNYGKIISAIKTHSPNAKIVMCNVTRGDDYFSSINTAIEEIAEHFEIPFMNLLSDVFFTSEFYKNGMIGSHPTPIVYSAYAKAIMRLFSKCCVSYLTYFMS